jgi:hypothetical protein
VELDDVVDRLNDLFGRWGLCGLSRAFGKLLSSEVGAQGEAEVETLFGAGRETRRVRHRTKTGRGRANGIDGVEGELVAAAAAAAGSHLCLLWLASDRSESDTISACETGGRSFGGVSLSCSLSNSLDTSKHSLR